MIASELSFRAFRLEKISGGEGRNKKGNSKRLNQALPSQEVSAMKRTRIKRTLFLFGVAALLLLFSACGSSGGDSGGSGDSGGNNNNNDQTGTTGCILGTDKLGACKLG